MTGKRLTSSTSQSDGGLIRSAASLLHNLTKARVYFEAPHPYCQLPLILVSGFARSGTTVLRKTFAAHSRIHSNDKESNVIKDIMEAGWVDQELPQRRLSRVVRDDAFWAMFQNLVLQLHWPIPRTEANIGAISTYSHMTPRAMQGLQAAFPKCHACVIVRNGIEVISSFMNFPAFQTMGFKNSCSQWKTHISQLRRIEHEDYVSVFRHEWLYSSERLSEELGNVLSCVSLQNEDTCLKVVNTKRFHPTTIEGESPSHGNDLRLRRDRWRYWSEEERKLFVSECGDAMDYLGYEIPWN